MRTGYGMFNYNNFRYNGRNNAQFNGNYQPNNPWATGYLGGGNSRYEGKRSHYRRDGDGYHHRQNEKLNSAKVVQNHNWEEEWTQPQNATQHYKSVGLVIWVEGATGELFCERNVGSTKSHFYFDGRTEIDGTTVAVAERSEQGLGVFEGSKVEFEAIYKPPDPRETSPVLIHVTKITVYEKETPFEIESVSMVSFTDEPHIPKFALNKDGDFVLVSPLIFSKKWVIDCLETTVVGAVPEYPEQDHKHTCFRGRTLVGKIVTCPRFVGDVIGERINVKRMMLTLHHAESVIGGYATIRSIVPSQNVVIEADELPGELMFFSIVGLPRIIKDQFRVGTRVQYHACKELPGFTYPWKVLEAVVTNKPPPAREVLQEAVVQEDETPILESPTNNYSEVIASLVSLYTPPSSPGPSSTAEEPAGTATTSLNGYILDLDDFLGPTSASVEADSDGKSKESALDDLVVLGQNPLVDRVEEGRGGQPEEGEQENKAETENEDSDEGKENGPSSSPYAYLLKTPAYLSLPNTADPETVRSVIGCSHYDAYLDVERCVFPHEQNPSWLDEYNHVVETSAEQYAKQKQRSEERQKRKDERKALRSEARQRNRHQVKTKPSAKIHVSGGALPLLPGECEPPGEQVNVIGLYDDIQAIFNALLIENEKRKREEEEQRKNPAMSEIKEKEEVKRKKVEEEKPMEEPKKAKSTGSWWFRRRNPRILPSVVVAELLEGRTEEEICVDYKVDDLKETLVLRNSSFGRARKDGSAAKKPAAPSALSTTVTAAPGIENACYKHGKTMEISRIEEDSEKEPSRPVEKEIEKQPPPQNILANSLLNDKIFGTFFQSLLKK